MPINDAFFAADRGYNAKATAIFLNDTFGGTLITVFNLDTQNSMDSKLI